VFIYVNTSKQVGDADHLKVFANVDAAEKWFEENDPEGVAFEYEVLALLWHFRLRDICKEDVTVRTSSGWRSCEEVEDRLPDGRHAWLWWRS
jgi:hypothetical protein